MRSTTFTTFKLGIMTLFIALTISQVTVIAQNGEPPPRTLEGVWQVTVTPRNCLTGVPIPPAAFEALITFHKAGTLSAWFQSSTITTTRSASYGLWRQEHGWSDYSFKFVHLRYNLSSGAFIGKQISEGTLVLSESGDEFTTDALNTTFDVNGNPGPGSCSNSVGTRFKLDN